MTESRRCYDRNAAKWIEYEQIGIASNDRVGATVHGEFQKLVVHGIAALGYCLGDNHQFGRRENLTDTVKEERGNFRGDSTSPENRDDLLLGDRDPGNAANSFDPTARLTRPSALH